MNKQKKLILVIITILASLFIHILTSLLLNRFSLANQIVFYHYLSQLKYTILLLIPVVIIFLTPLRKYLDYANYITKPKESHFLVAILLISFIATNFISWKYYNHLPKGDDIAMYKQAQIFKTGHRWVPSHIYTKFFDTSFMVNSRGRYFAIPAPGHPLFILSGLFINAPWIICPLLGLILLLILYLLLKNLSSPLTARTGAVFLLLSPSFLLFSASMLNQNSSAMFALLGLFLTVKSLNVNSRLSSFIPLFAGMSIGIAFLSRPTIPLAFLISIAIFIIVMERKKQINTGTVILFVAGFLPFLIFQMYDNIILSGHPFHYGYSLPDIPKINSTGFGNDVGETTFGIHGHTPIKALINLFYNCFTLSLHLFGWPLLSLIFILLWRPKIPFEWLISGIIICTVIFMAFYWFHGMSPVGNQYYYEIVPLLVIITVKKIETLKLNIRPIITLLFLIDIFAYIPHTAGVFKLWGINNNCYNEVRKLNIHNSIIFVKDPPLISNQNEKLIALRRYNYNSVSLRNEPDIGKSDNIYARDMEDEMNSKLKKLYPERKTYMFEYLGNSKEWHIIPY